MSRNNKKNGIPDRWLDYTPVGKRLQGTRFIAFKVPLKQSLNFKLSRQEVFGPWELLDMLNRDNQELGLIIDLTFTNRYYRVQDLPESLLFVKIFTAGHEIPTDQTILSFKRAVRNFLRDNADNDKLIGVHCTHGVNRTGYLICRYLIDVDGMDPQDAVQLFNSSRGHSIERQNYLDDLQSGPKRSNEGMEASEQEPRRGGATHRPSDSDRRDERRQNFSESRYHSRHFPPRDRDRDRDRDRVHRPRHPRYLDGVALQPYRWTASYEDTGSWRGPPRSEETWSRFPPADQGWQWSSHWSSHWQEDRRRYPPPPPSLPRYSPPEESRHPYRQTHRNDRYGDF